jgi:hypothetical protein
MLDNRTVAGINDLSWSFPSDQCSTVSSLDSSRSISKLKDNSACSPIGEQIVKHDQRSTASIEC